MAKTLPEIIAGEIRAEAARHNASTSEIATWLKLSRASTSRRMNGKWPFTTPELEILAEKFGVTVEWFLRDRTGQSHSDIGDAARKILGA